MPRRVLKTEVFETGWNGSPQTHSKSGTTTTYALAWICRWIVIAKQRFKACGTAYFKARYTILPATIVRTDCVLGKSSKGQFRMS